MDFKLFMILATVVIIQFKSSIANQTVLHVDHDSTPEASSTTETILDIPTKKNAKRVKNHPHDQQVDEKINVLASQLVQAIVTKLDIEAKITDLVLDTLATMSRKKIGVQAIKTRRILEYISKKMSAQIMKSAKKETRNSNISPFVYGLAQTTAEISIVAALKDITFATPLIADENVDLGRPKRNSAEYDYKSDFYRMNMAKHPNSLNSPYQSQELKGFISNKDKFGDNLEVLPLQQRILRRKPRLVTGTQRKTRMSNYGDHIDRLDILPMFKLRSKRTINVATEAASNKVNKKSADSKIDSFDLLPLHQKSSIKLTNNLAHTESKGFFNQTRMEFMKNNLKTNGSHGILLHGEVSESVVLKPSDDYDVFNNKNNSFDKQDESDLAAIEQFLEKAEDKAKSAPKLEELETQANKAIDFCGDVAVYAGESTIALRRALTAALEVKMSVNNAKEASSNSKNLAMNLAKTAARQSGKEAKIANVKSSDSEKSLREATKLTALSIGSSTNHLATRILIESIALSTIAKSMAYVSSEVAIDSLYQVADVKKNM